MSEEIKGSFQLTSLTGTVNLADYAEERIDLTKQRLREERLRELKELSAKSKFYNYSERFLREELSEGNIMSGVRDFDSMIAEEEIGEDIVLVRPDKPSAQRSKVPKDLFQPPGKEKHPKSDFGEALFRLKLNARGGPNSNTPSEAVSPVYRPVSPNFTLTPEAFAESVLNTPSPMRPDEYTSELLGLLIQADYDVPRDQYPEVISVVDHANTNPGERKTVYSSASYMVNKDVIQDGLKSFFDQESGYVYFYRMRGIGMDDEKEQEALFELENEVDSGKSVEQEDEGALGA